MSNPHTYLSPAPPNGRGGDSPTHVRNAGANTGSRPLAHHAAELPPSLAGDGRRSSRHSSPSALQLTIPRLLGTRVDQAHGVAVATRREQALWTTALILLAVSVARGIFTLIQNYYSEAVGHHAAYELRLACYEKLQRLSFSFHDRVHSGDLIMLGIIDIDGVRMFFATGAVRVVLLAVLIGVGAYLLLSTDVLLGPPGAELRAVRRLALVGVAAQAARDLDELQDRLPMLSRVMEENLGGIRVVRAFAAQLHELRSSTRLEECP